MRTLEETIRICEGRLANPDLSRESREREEAHLHYHRELQRYRGMKHCHRYGELAVDQCEVCESCQDKMDLSHLAWNERDE
ncbi:hypothetical protein DSECCO2_337040 [anaerobic digester metagenome]